MTVQDQYHVYRDTIMFLDQNATTMKIPGAWLDRSGIMSITLLAGYGPKTQKGSGGNVSNALGYWIGGNERAMQIMVGQPLGTLAVEPRRMTPKEVGWAYLNAIAPHDETAAELLARLK